MADETRVADDPSRLQYELYVGGRAAGLIRYRRLPGALVLVHTEVDPAFEGHGLGTRLIAETLADVRELGLHIVPVCPFVQAYLTRHPEDVDLVLSDSETPD